MPIKIIIYIRFYSQKWYIGRCRACCVAYWFLVCHEAKRASEYHGYLRFLCAHIQFFRFLYRHFRDHQFTFEAKREKNKYANERTNKRKKPQHTICSSVCVKFSHLKRSLQFQLVACFSAVLSYGDSELKALESLCPLFYKTHLIIWYECAFIYELTHTHE